MEHLKDVIMKRDGMTEKEANEAVEGAKLRVLSGEDPEEVLVDDFNLEPDYVFDLLDGNPKLEKVPLSCPNCGNDADKCPCKLQECHKCGDETYDCEDVCIDPGKTNCEPGDAYPPEYASLCSVCRARRESKREDYSDD